jgi:tetratricopeptide (TPR) repeat protein
MTRRLTILSPLLFIFILSTSAQTYPQKQLDTALTQYWQGHFEAAIDLLRPLVESKESTETDQGRGWILLGSAYQYQSKFQEAITAYENALRIFERRDEDATDYASALSAFGTLYRDMHRFGDSAQMESRALVVNEKINNHAGIAAVCASLADLELGLKHARKAQMWLDRATQESKLAPKLGDTFYAFVASTQAGVEELRGHTRAAIDGYLKEIEYLTRLSGEDSFQVGWAYMLLGKAYLKAGDISNALSDMRKGCAILTQTVGTDSLRYLFAQVEYSNALSSAGMHAEAAQTKAEAEQKLKRLYQQQCTQCRTTAMALH